MRAQQIMTVRPVVATRDKNLQEVAELMVEYDCGEIPVVDSEDTMIPVGVITDRDIVCRSVARGRNPLVLTAEDCMTTPCVTVELHEKVEDCCRVLEEQQLRRVLVVDRAGRLCGIISQADIAEFARPEQTIAVVREVSQRSNGRGTLQPLL
ncbi:MAG TPA: CBS domain-containing protein [Steroidobacteraceae bacterium]|jgi:CBS domain-containing protein|nr:CBS domain-containing protein [Steroidobacteraceae bacterium]